MAAPFRPLRVLFWGTYDRSKPRTRILIEGLRANGAKVDECHTPIWEAVRDKGVLSRWSLAWHLVRTATAYPRLVARFLRRPAPDVLIVGYMGQLDVLLLRPFARLRRVPVVWDQFISLYDTVVNDRRQLSNRHPFAWALYLLEWAACRAADCVLMDTRAHAAHVTETFGLTAGRVRSVWVGAETSAFPPLLPRAAAPNGSLSVLFYGQLIPLHGVQTIVEAARLLQGNPVRFVLVGSGQEGERLRELLSAEPLSNLEWHPWVEYERLVEYIRDADVCLGIFGATGKASRVIPNKAFQVIAAGRPLITRDSPAIRELLGSDADGIRLVPPADGRALAGAIRELANDPGRGTWAKASTRREAIAPRAIGKQLLDVLESVLTSRRLREI
ncbi:MAG: glycosyltransferase [Deltaproteobacteria bacterium]